MQNQLRTVNSDSARISVLKNISWEYLNNRGDLETAKKYIDSFNTISKNNKMPWGISIAHYQYAVLDRQKGNYGSALEHIEEYLDYSRQTNKPFSVANGLYQKAVILDNLGDMGKSLEIYYDILKIYQEHNDPFSIATTQNAIGEILKNTGKMDEAMENYQSALKIFSDLGDKIEMANCLFNIGDTYLQQENYMEARSYFFRALQLDEEMNSDWGKAFDYEAIGKVYGHQKNYSQSLDYHQRALELREKLGMKLELAMSHNQIALIHLELKNYPLAKENIERAIQISEEIGAKTQLQENYELLSKIHEASGEYEQALAFKNEAISLKDSLFNVAKSKQIEELQVRYDTEKQQNAIASLQKDAEINDLRLERQKTLRNFIIAIAIGTMLAFLYSFRRFKQKQREKQVLDEKKRAIEVEKKRTEIEKQRVLELEKINTLKDEFLANTSHELRTPLVGIIGLSEGLKDGVAGKMSKSALQNLEMIINSGKRLSHLVNDILDFSKLKNKDLNLSIKPVDIYAISNIVLRLSRPLTQDKKLKLINSIPKDTPLIDADENRLQQIMHNLIGNAIKFTEKGVITLHAAVNKEMLSISVSDTGIGIPDDKIDRIFDSFEQVDGSTEREYGGTGLGLSVTKKLVELHGGTITVDSKKGKGSIFTFTLPLSKTKREDYEGLTTDKPEMVTPIQDYNETETINVIDENTTLQDAPTILIVDDEPVNRRVLENHLKMAGYQIMEAGSGIEALKIVQQGTPINLVLLDVMMPGTSGYEVCEKIREKYLSTELPVILLTAKNTVTDLVSGFNAGANDYLTKPFSKGELLSRIKTHLNLNIIHRATSKFVPSEFVKSIGKESITDVQLGDYAEKEVTVLFSDIRDYTTLSESMTPQQNFKFVNAYVGRMGPIIKENEGFVNQYLGDGIMALFPKSPEGALDAAIEMQRALALYNKRRVEEKGYRPLSIGIGLHTGPLIMGIIGDSKRNDPAVISDTVNCASRVEGVTKHFGANIIISGDTLNQMQTPSDFNFRFLGKVRVKGKQKSIEIYECIDGDSIQKISLKLETKAHYDQGIALYYDCQFDEAATAFQWVLYKNPGDTVAHYFNERAKKYAVLGPPEDWTSGSVLI
ncbi:ATP-binding protein [Flagellimonas sp. GZD32]|uniref:ATP-binding protein n=1 Tax=Flagellimonas cixiensis TaxID=3228750 RepID=UPI0035C8ED31